MLRFLSAVILSLLGATPVLSQPLGSWQDHLSYKNAISVTNGDEFIYCGTENAYFVYHKKDKYLVRQSKATKLSDVGISSLKYYNAKGLLLVAYSNTNLDIVKGKEVTNISDILRYTSVGEKRINDIYFNGDFAYLSCSFGIVVVDLIKNEVKDTYKIGPVQGEEINIHAVATHNGFIYAASEVGLHRAPLSGTNLLNYNNWDVITGSNNLPDEPVYYVAPYNNNLFTSVQDTVFRLQGGQWQVFYADGYTANYMSGEETHLVLTSTDTSAHSRIVLLDEQGNAEILLEGQMSGPIEAIEDDNGHIWIADIIRGLLHYWEGNLKAMVPNGPFASALSEMVVKDGLLYVASGGHTSNFKVTYNQNGFYYLDGFSWNNVNQYTNTNFSNFWDIEKVLPSPDRQTFYLASYLNGLGILKDGNLTIYNAANSPLEHAPSVPSVTHVNDVVLDRNNVLWLTNRDANQALVAYTPQGNWHKFSVGVTTPDDLEIDDFGQKWMLLPNEAAGGIAVFDEGEELESKSDDRSVILSVNNGALHTNDVTCIAKDRDGEIWIGTAEGVAVFYCPGQVLDMECASRRIFVEQDSMTGYLFQNEQINSIAVDGANRKWIGTSNGVWLMSDDGTEEILHFNKDNSPLFANNIIDIAIDHNSGTVYFGTEKGIIAYKGDATEGGDIHENVIVYPNPVREDYFGDIAIKGLAVNAQVKITDVNGRLIYETTAYGGQAVWDGKNYNGERAQTGVYLVFSTNENGTDSFVTKFLIIN